MDTVRKDPAKVNWKEAGAEYLCESTGIFKELKECQVHLGPNGVKKVVVSAPSKTAPMFVMGVNEVWPGLLSCTFIFTKEKLQEGPDYCLQRILHHKLPCPSC